MLNSTGFFCSCVKLYFIRSKTLKIEENGKAKLHKYLDKYGVKLYNKDNRKAKNTINILLNLNKIDKIKGK